MIVGSEQLMRGEVRESSSPMDEATNGGPESEPRGTHNPHFPKQPGKVITI